MTKPGLTEPQAFALAQIEWWWVNYNESPTLWHFQLRTRLSEKRAKEMLLKLEERGMIEVERYNTQIKGIKLKKTESK